MQLRFKEGEIQKGKTGPKRHGEGGTCFFTDIITSLLKIESVIIFYTCLGPDERSTQSRHAKVGKTGKQNIAIQDNPPAAEGGPENFLVAKLVI